MRSDAMLDLFLTEKKGFVGNVELQSSLGWSDHDMMEC